MQLFLTCAGMIAVISIYMVSGFVRVFHLMNVGANYYSISYLIFLFIGMFFSVDFLRKSPLWWSVLVGAVAGYLSSFVAYFVACFFIPDGIERLSNSVSMMGWGSLFIFLWIPILLLCWLWGAIGFLVVSGLSKQLTR